MKKSLKKLSLCALLCAVAMVIMLIGCIFQSLDLTVAVAAGLTVAIAMIECGTGYSLMLYFATAILGFVLLPAKTPPLFYLMMGGIYPIIKSYIERIPAKWLAWIVKLLGFNLFLTGVICVGKFLFNFEDPIFSFNIFVYGLGNLTFVLYDYVFSRLATIYVGRIRRKLK